MGAAQRKTAEEIELIEDGHPKKPKVLITDDQANFGKVMKGFLDKFGYEVVFVECKDEAIARLREINPDVVTTDLTSLKMDGFEFIRLVKEFDPSIPVIALSGNLNTRIDVNGEKARRALRLGAFDCIQKPCDGSVIRAAIERALKTRRSPAER